MKSAFPVGEYIADELKARGWTTSHLANRMGGDPHVNRLAVELLIANVGGRLSWETAEGLARAFAGIDAQTWMNLDASYHRARTEDA